MSGISHEDVHTLSVRELKAALVSLGSSGAGCIEKSDLQERLVALLSRTMDQEQTTSSAGGKAGAVGRKEEAGVHGLLDCVILEGGATQNCKGVLTVVLMHGYGANKEDLAPIGDASMDTLAAAAGEREWRVRFLVPDAPFVLQGASRQWWPLDMMRLAMAAMSGQLDAIWNENPDEETNSNSTQRVVDFLEKECQSVATTYGAGVDHRIVLSGFSQGAMLAANVALRHAARLPQIRTLCLFSSAMVTKAEWVELAEGKSPLACGAESLRHLAYIRSQSWASGSHHFASSNRTERVMQSFHSWRERSCETS